MCGIVGYIGKRQAQPILLEGLKSLEYRGYDSSGMAVILSNKQALSIRKTPGKINVLEGLLKRKPLSGFVGIAHTRWATHGAPNQENAHPHIDCNEEIAVVHNGIIENYAILKDELMSKGHRFSSQTDTEVIVHLIEAYLSEKNNLEEAVVACLKRLEGSFAIAVITSREPCKIIGARLGSPLIVGIGQQEYFLASDAPAIINYTRQVIFLEENQLVILTADSVIIKDFNGKELPYNISRIDWDVASAQKAGYPHFMLKEINEQPAILTEFFNRRIKQDNHIYFEEQRIPEETLRAIKNISIVACGTAYHAGYVGKYVLESLCGIPTTVDVSSEFRYRDLLIDKDTLVLAISQSGETADTLAGVRQAKKRGSPVLAICNVLGSTLTRESDSVIYTHAGPEIGVASTKAYTAQLAALYLFALYLGRLRNTISGEFITSLLKELSNIPALIEKCLADQHDVMHIAHRHTHFGSFLYLGRYINYPSALEGALKLKEISYIPAEGYAAGEMKHGPIALIDEYRAVVCIVCASKVYDKMISNLQEIKARKGKIIAIATTGDTKIREHVQEVIYVPPCRELFSPLVVAIPLQLIAYHIAVQRGCDVDQPRNLAKSVTVE